MTTNGFGPALRRLVRGQLTLDDLWLFLPPLALLIILDLYLIRPYDFWWHLRTGQLIVQTGAVPTVDLFTYTRAGMPWTNQSWLTQVLFYLLYRAGNLPLVIFWHALTIAAGYVLIELACLINSRGETRPAAVATVAAASLSVFNWNIRPQTTSFLLFGLLVFILETHRSRRTRLIWLTPALFAVWGNTHGGFVFGLALLGIYVAIAAGQEWIARRKPGRETDVHAAGAATAHENGAEHPERSGGVFPATQSKDAERSLAWSHPSTASGTQRRTPLRMLRFFRTTRLAIVLVLSVLMLSLNPAGPLGMVQYVVGFLSSGATQNNNLEFQPLSIRTVDGVIFVAVTAIFLVIVYLRRLTLPPYLVATLLGFGLWSLYSRRVEPWFGMAAAPALALALTPRAKSPSPTPAVRRNKPLLNTLLLGLLALLVCGSLPWLRPSLPLPLDRRTWVLARETPVRATELLCQLGDTVRIFSDMGYSSYVSWACPSTPVFMDTRFELYPAQMWKEYLSVSIGRYDWETILAKYGVNLIFVNKVEEPTLIAAIRASANWQHVYEDADSVIFRKREQ